jgi:hypothetical protein
MQDTIGYLLNLLLQDDWLPLDLDMRKSTHICRICYSAHENSITIKDHDT